jgi:hypothetical protein
MLGWSTGCQETRMTRPLPGSRAARLGLLVLALVTSLICAAAAPSAAARARPAPSRATPPPPRALDPATVPTADRDRVLPAGWRTSADLAWTTAGDATGFHLLIAAAKTGYTWRTVATLREPGIDTDQWIGNACLTGSGRRAVVVYAPRHFTNRDNLFGRGGFAAVVDLTTGAVRKLAVGVSLAYYDPGCGAAETAVLTQSAVTDLGRTRLHVVDAARAAIVRRVELAGQITSAVPVGGGIVAAGGGELIGLAADGSRRTLAKTRGVAFDVHPDAAGGVAFLDQPAAGTAAVNYLSAGRIRRLGVGPLTGVSLVAGTGGRVFVTGSAGRLTSAPASLRPLAVDAHAEISSQGQLALTRLAPAPAAAPPDAAPEPSLAWTGGPAASRLAASAPNGLAPNGLAAAAQGGPAQDGAAQGGAAGTAEPAPYAPAPVLLRATVVATRAELRFRTVPGAEPAAAAEPARGGAAVTGPRGSGTAARAAAARIAESGQQPSPAGPLAGNGGAITAVNSPTDPFDADASCGIPRNDPRLQVKQPHWKQVEWAADLAVVGALNITRPANWNQANASAPWSPQSLFPRRGLTGTNGGHVPASIMLGILAQESNLWQASGHALEGQTGNPLIGSYYGASGWNINWANADCGYGVAQVTDGMRKAGREKPGEHAWSPDVQKAIALDYATNIAAGLQILEQKWNSLVGVSQINDADPSKIENWFTAIWAYNSGLNPQAGTGNTTGCIPGPACTDGARGNWGLGWANNPANPDYPYNRLPFLNGENGEGSPADAAVPNHWPYPEKVIGWAAYPIVKYDFRNPDHYEAGYRQAWWVDNYLRTAAKPPLRTFCESDNNCTVAGNGRGSCGYSDFHCWWHWNATWKANCQTADNGGTVVNACGFDAHTYEPGAAEPPDGTHYPPTCSTAGLPAGALIVDDAPGVPPVRTPCAPTASSGTFGLQFAGNGSGLYPSKVDFHQVGGGLNAHFWFAHTYTTAYDAANHVKVTGTWTLNSSWTNTWGRVLVHIPGHGAQTQQADYVVDTGAGAAGTRFRHRIVNTKTRYRSDAQNGDRWASLGVFNFTGTPAVSLSNITTDGAGLSSDPVQDIAYDAVAFQRLPAKPRNFVVTLGDSYTSGEGASTNPAVDYYRETDADGSDDVLHNGCHRSPNAWVRRTALADSTTAIGARADAWDDNLDFQFIACSWAETHNVLPANGPADAWGFTGDSPVSSSEVPQLDAGYLDENTTLVTLSIGGNDARFGEVVSYCLQNDPDADCQNERMDGDPDPLKVTVPDMIRTKVKDSIGTVLDTIHARAPAAKVVLMGYPRLIQNARCLQVLDTPIDGVALWLTDNEATWMNQMADVLATAMQDAVTPRNAYASFADPRPDFDGRGVCASANESINAVIFGTTPGEVPLLQGPFASWGPSAQSFHPNKLGTGQYAITFTRALRARGL